MQSQETDKQFGGIDIMDLGGRKLFSTFDSQIDMSGFSSGIYLISVKFEDGSVQSLKILKR